MKLKRTMNERPISIKRESDVKYLYLDFPSGRDRIRGKIDRPD